MKKTVFASTVLIVLLIETLFAANVLSADYDLTGIWNYTLSGNWANGDIGCNPGPDASGTCTITQTGDTFTFAYTSGVVCSPAESCTFTGAVNGAVYTCSTTDIVDDEGGSVTSTILFTASLATSANGLGSSNYTHPSDNWECTWGSSIALTRPDEQPQPGQYVLTITTVGPGTVTLNPPGGIYNAGIQVQLIAVPDSSEEFNIWDGDLSGSDNPTTITMDSDKSVQATFTDIPDNDDDSGGSGGGGGGCFISTIKQQVHLD